MNSIQYFEPKKKNIMLKLLCLLCPGDIQNQAGYSSGQPGIEIHDPEYSRG